MAETLSLSEIIAAACEKVFGTAIICSVCNNVATVADKEYLPVLCGMCGYPLEESAKEST